MFISSQHTVDIYHVGLLIHNHKGEWMDPVMY